MIREFLSDFPFNGGRDYVHGPKILSTFYDHALLATDRSGFSSFAVNFFRVDHLVTANGTIVVHDTASKDHSEYVDTPMAEMKCKVDGEEIVVRLFDRNQIPIKKHQPSLEQDLVHSVRLQRPFAGTAQLTAIKNNADLFHSAIEANKQLHGLTMDDHALGRSVKFQFMYCLNYAFAPDISKSNGTVVIRNIGVKEAGERCFILNQIELAYDGAVTKFNVCFASRDAEDLMDVLKAAHKGNREPV